ncbi:hypothetical protein BCR43DRAFT_520142 [Syncephalastrum racemosum]|uniref:PH domain-containing protein n=1 Tax=Syncephalastrum racemosum TaxID=13706 RepID=A0A1X2HUY6_SYNRA|nr:hypothetical protein BCR43DRAFT_520142 [Syncephalastrum racemosum]
MPLHHQRNHPQTPSPTKAPLDRALLKNAHEVPATAPIFEGNLYLRTEKKRWQWRLFRFDGTCFTCLSSRKVRLPPDTTVDTAIHPSPSFNTCLTSPLLATPKDKAKRLTSSIGDSAFDVSEPMLASYYQLPKWTVEVSTISAISVLKRSKKRNPFSGPAPKSRCFCIRTFDGQCYVMKAQKYKDLERWLFVLTKMWKFAQTIRAQVEQQLHSQATPMPTPSPPQLVLAAPPRPTAGTSSSMHQPRHSRYVTKINDDHDDDSTNDGPVMRSLVPPAPLALHSPPQPQPQPQPQHYQQDPKYCAPTLSHEKVEWIDEWRKSLAELVAADANVSFAPPPIESIPDDDKLSSISGLTSVSAREYKKRPVPILRRKSSNRRSNSLRRAKQNSIAPEGQEMPLEDRPSSNLRKKRSDEVKNWISTNTNHNNGGPQVLPDLDFFQDVKTTLGSGDELRSQQQHQQTAVRYHTSIRGRNVHVVNTSSDDTDTPAKVNMVTIDPSQPGMAPTDIHQGASPLQTLTNHVSVRDDEDMSLADLQRSLRRVSMNDYYPYQQQLHARSPSASSVLDIRPTMTAPIPPPHAFHQHHQYARPTPQHLQRAPVHNGSSVLVAPAEPPVPVQRSPPSALYFENPALPKTEKSRPRSWMAPSSSGSSLMDKQQQKSMLSSMMKQSYSPTYHPHHHGAPRRSIEIDSASWQRH